jgi:hypothetical protein
MAETVEFKCPHTKGKFANRQERLAKRAEKLAVPADAEWKNVQDVRMGPYGVIEVFDVSDVYYALVTCPVCGDTKRVQTDKKVK